MLNLLNKPSKELKENYKWNEEVKEIQSLVDERKTIDELGKRMGDTKLDELVSNHHHKIGFTNHSKQSSHKLMQLSTEIHESHKEKQRQKRESPTNSKLEFFQ